MSKIKKINFSLEDKPVVSDAFSAAMRHHAGIYRKYTGEPYINHPIRVAELMVQAGYYDQDSLAAAFLHDCAEDECIDGHKMNINRICSDFGPRVGRFVGFLTKSGSYKTRASRESVYATVVGSAPQEVIAIKMCDMLDNTKDIVEHDLDFAQKYIEEKQLFLKRVRDKSGYYRRSEYGVGSWSCPRLDTLDGMLSLQLTDQLNLCAQLILKDGLENEAKMKALDEEVQSIIAAEQIDKMKSLF